MYVHNGTGDSLYLPHMVAQVRPRWPAREIGALTTSNHFAQSLPYVWVPTGLTGMLRPVAGYYVLSYVGLVVINHYTLSLNACGQGRRKEPTPPHADVAVGSALVLDRHRQAIV